MIFGDEFPSLQWARIGEAHDGDVWIQTSVNFVKEACIDKERAKQILEKVHADLWCYSEKGTTAKKYNNSALDKMYLKLIKELEL